MRVTAEARGYLPDYARKRANQNVPMQAVLNHIGVRLRQAFAENFAQSGRPAWTPLSPRAMAEKQALFFAGVIAGRRANGSEVARGETAMAPGALLPLIRTGTLRRSVVERGSPGNLCNIDAASGTIVVGTSVPYGIRHQVGEGRLPARPFLTYTDSDLDTIVTEVVDLLTGLDTGGEDE